MEKIERGEVNGGLMWDAEKEFIKVFGDFRSLPEAPRVLSLLISLDFLLVLYKPFGLGPFCRQGEGGTSF